MKFTERHWHENEGIYSLYKVDEQNIFYLFSDFDAEQQLWNIISNSEVPFFIQTMHPAYLFEVYSKIDTDYKINVREEPNIRDLIINKCNLLAPTPSIDGDPKHVYPTNILRGVQGMTLEQYSNWIEHLLSEE